MLHSQTPATWRPKAVLFDLDGVLVESWTLHYIPKAVECLKILRRHDIPFGIATNQGGPLWHTVTSGKHPGKPNIYPTVEQVGERLLTIRTELDILDALCMVAVYDERAMKLLEETDPPLVEGRSEYITEGIVVTLAEHRFRGLDVSSLPEWRKPGSGMLSHASIVWGIPYEGILFIDDMESGATCAKSVGMPYVASVEEALMLLRTAFE